MESYMVHTGIFNFWFILFFILVNLLFFLVRLKMEKSNLNKPQKNKHNIESKQEPIYISGKELMAHWNMEGFELFNCLKKGLQPYTQYGQKIIDTDTLEHDRNNSLEYYIGVVRGSEEAGSVVYPGSSRYIPLTDQQIVQRGKELYERQPLKPIDPPPNHMSYTLPNDNKKAAAAIKEIMELKFKRDEALSWSKKIKIPRHGNSKYNKSLHPTPNAAPF